MTTMLYQGGSCVSGKWFTSGCLDCPKVCSTTLTWDAVYAKVSGLDILEESEHVDVFLNTNVDSLGAIVSIQPADFLEF